MSIAVSDCAYLATTIGGAADTQVAKARTAAARYFGCTPFEIIAKRRLSSSRCAFIEVNPPADTSQLASMRGTGISIHPIRPATRRLDHTLRHCAGAISWLSRSLEVPVRSAFQSGRPLLLSANLVGGRLELNHLTFDDWRIFSFRSAVDRHHSYQAFLWCQSWLAQTGADLGFQVLRRRGSPTLMAIGRAAGL